MNKKPKQKYIKDDFLLYSGIQIEELIESLQKASEGLANPYLEIDTPYYEGGVSEFYICAWRDFTPEELEEEKEKAKQERERKREQKKLQEQNDYEMFQHLKKKYEPEKKGS